jgi:dihydrolipoyl dehydrogenase
MSEMATEERIDVLVIGGGPGGTPAALALAQAGKHVMLVEAGRGLGGTCLFEGCIPSKIFRETAARRHALARAGEFGLRAPAPDELNVDWPTVQARRHRILSARSQGALHRARKLPGLEVAFGRARVTGPRSALIEMPDVRRQVRFEQAILATGSVPNRLPIPGAMLPGVLDSAQLIDIDFVPASLTLIGGGPIGIEMAQIFAMLGSRVAVLESAPRILQPVDEVLATGLQHRIEADGIVVHTGVAVTSIEGQARDHRVHYELGGAAAQIESEVVAIVAGRHPNIDDLGLETTAVSADRHGVKVDAKLQTDEPGIYATGDLIGHPMFAHWATAQALAVAQHLLARPAVYPSPETNSAVIFSYPELGMAGMTEATARAAALDVAVAEYDYRADARAQISGDADGLLRIVYRRDDMRIVGIHALVEGAADLMGEAALAIEAGITLPQLAAAIHPHPTLTEAFGFAARAALAGA